MKKQFTLFVFAMFMMTIGYSQGCVNTESYGTANVSTPGIKEIATCSFLGEYSTITGVNAGYEYEFTAQASENMYYITVRTGTVDGALVGSGTSPLTITAPTNQDLFVHWNLDSECGTASVCTITTAACITCNTVEDCEGVIGGSVGPGTPCDDGDANTINDIYDADCGCAGVSSAPGNACAFAIPVVCNAEPVTYSSATSIATDVTSCSMGNNGLWFSLVGTGGNITVNSSATFDHEMSINTGTCGALVDIECVDESTEEETYTINSSVLDQVYYVYIARYSSGSSVTGDITINVVCGTPPVCTPPNMFLLYVDQDGNGTKGCLRSENGYYVRVFLEGGSGNTSYSVSADGGDTVEIATEDTGIVGPFPFGTSVTITAVGIQDDDCSVSLDTESPQPCGPSNDDCYGAILLECGETVTGNTATATASDLPTDCSDFSSSDAFDVFYSFEADGTSNYLLSLDQPSGSFGLDGVLFVYSGFCEELTIVECSDTGNPEEILLEAPAAGTYTVRLFDYSNSAEFTLSLECTTLGINENNSFTNTHLYPNPLNDNTFYVVAPQLNGERVEVNIADVAGRQIFNKSIVCFDNKVTVNVNDDLSSGVYLVTMKHANEVHTYKLVKE